MGSGRRRGKKRCSARPLRADREVQCRVYNSSIFLFALETVKYPMSARECE